MDHDKVKVRYCSRSKWRRKANKSNNGHLSFLNFHLSFLFNVRLMSSNRRFDDRYNESISIDEWRNISYIQVNLTISVKDWRKLFEFWFARLWRSKLFHENKLNYRKEGNENFQLVQAVWIEKVNNNNFNNTSLK